MGIAATDVNGDGRPTSSSGTRAARPTRRTRADGTGFTDVRKSFAFGVNPTGWGDSWVDLRNSGTNELVVANGGIPVTNLRKDARARSGPGARRASGFVDSGLLRSIRVNGRGLAAADYDNDGRVDLAVNTIGGPLLLAPQHVAGGQLARGAGRAVLARRRRHRRRRRAAAGRCARCRPARATSLRRIRACTSASARRPSGR